MEKEKLHALSQTLSIGKLKRHIFLCLGPSCCSNETGQAAWEELKKQIKENGLADGPNACYRTKVGCLRMCMGGPVAVVYPEGTWYHGLGADKIPRLVKEHLSEGNPIEEWIFAKGQLPENPGSSSGD